MAFDLTPSAHGLAHGPSLLRGHDSFVQLSSPSQRDDPSAGPSARSAGQQRAKARKKRHREPARLGHMSRRKSRSQEKDAYIVWFGKGLAEGKGL